MCITARLFGSDLSWLGFAEAQVCRPTQYIRSLPSSTTTYYYIVEFVKESVMKSPKRLFIFADIPL